MNYCVTGGAGSIGSELCRRLVRDGRSVTALDYDEERLWELKCELPEIEARLYDVTDGWRIDDIAGDAEVLVNCAAKKHVHFCQDALELAMRVNSEGENNLASWADSSGIQHIFLSTDKAIEPHCAMGRSKRSGEMHCLHHHGNVVRFGNVIGTRGSLVPAMVRYARLNKPIPITDPNMTRWFMSIDEAVDLILEACHSNDKARIFHPHTLRSARVGEFIDVCRELFAPDHPIEIVGPRSGERTHEFMYHGDELVQSDDERFLMDRAKIRTLLWKSFDPNRPDCLDQPGLTVEKLRYAESVLSDRSRR